MKNISERMRAHVAMSMAVGALLLPFAVKAGDYFEGETFESEPVVEGNPHITAEDGAEDYQNEAQANPTGEIAKHVATEEKVKAKLDRYLNSEDGDVASLTPDQFEETLQKAQTGDMDAMQRVADAYRDGIGHEQSNTNALEWYKKAAEAGIAENYSIIGDMYRATQAPEGIGERLENLASGGDGITHDDLEARRWYERGAVEGDWRSYYQLSLLYRDGLAGLEKNNDTAEWYYKHAISLKQQMNEASYSKLEAKARAEVEKEEGVAPSRSTLRRPGEARVAIDGTACNLSAGTVHDEQYYRVYDASCPDLTGQIPIQKQVDFMLYRCDIKPANDATTKANYRLFCNGK